MRSVRALRVTAIETVRSAYRRKAPDVPPLSDMSRPGRALRSVPGEVVVAAFGIALLAGAVAANQRWLDRHFLPSFFLPHQWYVTIQTGVRALIATLGAVLAIGVRTQV